MALREEAGSLRDSLAATCTALKVRPCAVRRARYSERPFGGWRRRYRLAWTSVQASVLTHPGVRAGSQICMGVCRASGDFAQ